MGVLTPNLSGWLIERINATSKWYHDLSKSTLVQKVCFRESIHFEARKVLFRGGGREEQKKGVVLLISFLSNNRGKKKGMGCFMNICFVKRVCA